MCLRICTAQVGELTGEGQGEVLAEDSDFSLSSGNSTELIRIFRAERSRRLCTGLDGAVMTPELSQISKLVFASRNHIPTLYYECHKGTNICKDGMCLLQCSFFVSHGIFYHSFFL
jgi:hypothetical protein